MEICPKCGGSKYTDALKEYNKGKPAWCMPRKGTNLHSEVLRIMRGEAPAPMRAPSPPPPAPAPAPVPSRKRIPRKSAPTITIEETGEPDYWYALTTGGGENAEWLSSVSTAKFWRREAIPNSKKSKFYLVLDVKKENKLGSEPDTNYRRATSFYIGNVTSRLGAEINRKSYTNIDEAKKQKIENATHASKLTNENVIKAIEEKVTGPPMARIIARAFYKRDGSDGL
jgi:hypothetical protein